MATVQFLEAHKQVMFSLTKQQQGWVVDLGFPPPDLPSIGVLPCVDMSGNPKAEYLGNGITGLLIIAAFKI